MDVVAADKVEALKGRKDGTSRAIVFTPCFEGASSDVGCMVYG
jgi:hypothetical protein